METQTNELVVWAASLPEGRHAKAAKRLIATCGELQLTIDQAGALLIAHKDYGASLSYMRKMLRMEHSPEAIIDAYEVRYHLESEKGAPSIIRVLELQERFEDASDRPEEAADMLAELFCRLYGRYRVSHFDEAIYLAIRCANLHGLDELSQVLTYTDEIAERAWEARIDLDEDD